MVRPGINGRETGESSNSARRTTRSAHQSEPTSEPQQDATLAHDVAESADGWGAFLDHSSNLLANFDWRRTFWRSTNSEKTTQVLAIRGTDDVKGVAQLWVIGKIDSPWLHQLGRYNYWSIKILLNPEDKKVLKAGLQKHGILGETWAGEWLATPVNFSAKKDYVEEQLRMMDDQSSRQGLEEIVELKCYPFTYDGTRTSRPDPGYCISQFKRGKTVAVEFQIHSRDFATPAEPTGTKDYSFHLQSIYLVEEKKPEVSTPKRRKRGPDEWLISPPRTRLWKPTDSPLEWSVPLRKNDDVIEIKDE